MSSRPTWRYEPHPPSLSFSDRNMTAMLKRLTSARHLSSLYTGRLFLKRMQGNKEFVNIFIIFAAKRNFISLRQDSFALSHKIKEKPDCVVVSCFVLYCFCFCFFFLYLFVFCSVLFSFLFCFVFSWKSWTKILKLPITRQLIKLTRYRSPVEA